MLLQRGGKGGLNLWSLITRDRRVALRMRPRVKFVYWNRHKAETPTANGDLRRELAPVTRPIQAGDAPILLAPTPACSLLRMDG